MCGRYTVAAPLDDLVEVFEVDHTVFENWGPRFNAAPTQDLPVLLRSSDGERRLGPMRWGLVPFWADDPSIGNRLINARSETAASKPAFREAFARRRCVVPMDGFYEWRARAVEGASKPLKIPFWVHRPDRRPFGVAGLWERWRSDGGEEPLVTFTILTTAASPWMRPLHDRMPAVLDDAGVTTWLDGEADPDALQSVLAPAPDDRFEAWEVSRDVNRPVHDDPALVEPVEGAERMPPGVRRA